MRIAGGRGDAGGVWFDGPIEMGMRVCLHARVAMRVLLELGRFPASDSASLYEGSRTVDWPEWLDARRTFAVSADVSDTPGLSHSGFAALKVKDAIVDVLRDALGARPNVDVRNPDVNIRLHVHAGEGKLFLDLAGEPLHRRGYRVAMTDAPLKENLAAAILVLGRAEIDLPLWDPMAGSGTFAIEQAMRARDIAPGLRRRFGFQRWPGFGGTAWAQSWTRLLDDAKGRILPKAGAPIVCGDRFTAAVEAARQNAAAAGVEADIEFERADVRDASARWTAGTLIMNPPYGERLMTVGEGESRPAPSHAGPRGPRPESSWTDAIRGVPQPSAHAPAPKSDEDDPHVQHLKLVGLYRGMAEAFLRFPGWGVVVLSGTSAWSEPVPWRPEITHRLFNGPLEVRLLRYEIPEDGKPPEIKLQPSRPRSKRPFAGGAASGQGQRSGPPFRGGPSRRR